MLDFLPNYAILVGKGVAVSLLDYEGLLKRKKPVAEKEKTENPLPLNLEKQLPTVSSSPKEDTARSNVEVV